MHLTSSNVKFEWTDVEQMAFEKNKQMVRHETSLSYPDFNVPFKIHTNASHTQLGAVISQNNKPIAFYSKKNFSWLKGNIQLLNVSCYPS